MALQAWWRAHVGIDTPAVPFSSVGETIKVHGLPEDVPPGSLGALLQEGKHVFSDAVQPEDGLTEEVFINVVVRTLLDDDNDSSVTPSELKLFSVRCEGMVKRALRANQPLAFLEGLERLSMPWCLAVTRQVFDASLLDQARRDGLARLRSLLQPIDFSADMAQHVTRFLEGTRGWLFDRVEAWERTREGMGMFEPARTLLLLGGPGTGKSCFVSRLALLRPDLVHTVIFCKHNDARRRDTRRLLSTIAFGLASSVPGLWPRVLAAAERLPSSADAPDVFRALLLEPCMALDQSSAAGFPADVVVLIDGLDEAESVGGRNEMAELIMKFLSKLSHYIRLIVTTRMRTREDEDLQSKLESLFCSCTVLDEQPSEQRADLEVYLRDGLVRMDLLPPNSPLIEPCVFALLAPGNLTFTYATMALKTRLKAIAEGNNGGFLTSKDIESLRPRPRGAAAGATTAPTAAGPVPPLQPDEQDSAALYALYEESLSRLMQRSSNTRLIVDALQVLAVAREPPLVSDLADILGVERTTLDPLLESLDPLFEVFGAQKAEQQVRPYHKSVIDFLVDGFRLHSRIPVLKRDACHSFVAHKSVRLVGQRLSPDRPFLASQREVLPGYSVRHAALHALEAGVLDQAEALLTNLRFLVALAEEPGALLSCRLALIRQVRDPDKSPVLYELMRWLALEDLQVLEKDPRLVLPHLLETPRATGLHAHVSAALEPFLSRRLPDPPAGTSGVIAYSLPLETYVPESYGSALMTLCGHKFPVFSCSFSSDGARILSSAADGTAVWDSTTGQLLQTLEGHFGPVSSCSFGCSGLRILTGSWDQTVAVWDATTGQRLTTLDGHAAAVKSCSFSPDDIWILSGSDDGTLILWDAFGETKVHTLMGHLGPVHCGSFSRDGALIVSGSKDCTLAVWGTATGELLYKLRGHQGAVNAASFSPDGSRIVSGGGDGILFVWDLSTSKPGPSWILRGHTSAISGCSYNHDGSRIVSSSFDSTLILWDSSTRQLLRRLQGHTNVATCCCFGPDGTRIVSGSVDKSLILWDISGDRDVSGGPDICSPEGHSLATNAYCFSPDGSMIVSGSHDRTLMVWESSTGKRLHALEGHANTVVRSYFSPDGARILSGSADGILILWDSSTGTSLRTLEGHSSPISCCSFSPDGTHFVSGAGAGTQLIVWGTDTGERLHELQGHLKGVLCCCYSPDGTRIVSGSDDRTLIVWGGTSGQRLLTIEGHSGPIICCAVSPDGTRIVSGSSDATLIVWDTSTGQSLHSLVGLSHWVMRSAFSADGADIAATSSASSDVMLWDSISGKFLRCLAPGGGAIATNEFFFGTSTQQMTSVDSDNNISLWQWNPLEFQTCARVRYGSTWGMLLGRPTGRGARGEPLGSVWAIFGPPPLSGQRFVVSPVRFLVL